MLEKLEIEYRKPYATRHTAISHALANGANPLAVAEQTGHDPQILFKHYASVLCTGQKLCSVLKCSLLLGLSQITEDVP